jgi:hypothetical protein
MSASIKEQPNQPGYSIDSDLQQKSPLLQEQWARSINARKKSIKILYILMNSKSKSSAK